MDDFGAEEKLESGAYRDGDCCELMGLAVPVPKNEHLRLETLRDAHILDTTRSSPDFDSLTNLAANIFDCPICLVSLVDLNRQWFKSAVGLAAPQTHRNLAFCAYTVLEESPDVFVVLNALEDPRFCNNALVTGPPHVIFYAGAAIMVDGQKLGSFCIIDSKPRESFSLREKKTLFDIGALVAKAIQWNRVASIGRSHRTQVMLSLTHNINTLSAGLHLQIEALLEDCNEATFLQRHEAVSELVKSMSVQCSTTMGRISSVLNTGRMLPSLVASFEEAAEVSAYGPKCELRDTLDGITALFSLTFSGIVCSVDSASFEADSQSCFVDLFFVVAFNALKSALGSAPSSPGTVHIQFSEFEWSKQQNEKEKGQSPDQQQQEQQQRVGDLVFTLLIPSVELRLVGDEQLSSLLDIVSGSQAVQTNVEGIAEYCLRVPCRLNAANVASAPARAADDEVEKYCRVLIVDDDEDSAKALQRFLESECSCSVELANTGHRGEIAYKAARDGSKPFDILFVDLLMPAGDGFEMMKRIHPDDKSWVEGPMSIAVIGAADQFDQYMQDFKNDPSACGFSYVVSKPYDFDIIKNMILSGAEPADSGRGSKIRRRLRHSSSFLEALTSSDFVKWSVKSSPPSASSSRVPSPVF